MISDCCGSRGVSNENYYKMIFFNSSKLTKSN